MQSSPTTLQQPANAAGETNEVIEQTPYRPPPNLLPLPYLSLAERDRRWRLVHRFLTRHQIDCLIVPSLARLDARTVPDARYLSQVGAPDVPTTVVFTPDRVTAFVENVEFWARAQPWCDDLRPAGADLPMAVNARLAECDPAPVRIGLIGLADAGPRSPGVELVRTLERAHPGADWVDPGPALRLMRARKSLEEVAYLRHSVQIAERAAAALLVSSATRPADLEVALWQAICSAGSESPPRPIIRTASGEDYLRPGSDATIPAGGVLIVEMTAAWGGYRASTTETVFVRPPDRQDREDFALLGRVWEAVRAATEPGARLATLVDSATRALASEANGDRWELEVELRGAGLGDDGPEQSSSHVGRDGRARIPAGSCFELRVTLKGHDHALAWGDCVVVRRGQAERLGRRPLAPLAERSLT